MSAISDVELENAALIEAFTAFLCNNQGRSSRTGEIYGDALRRLASAHKARTLLELGMDDLVLYAGPLLHRQGVRARGRRPHIAAIRGFYAWAKRSQRIDVDPAEHAIDYPKTARPLPRTISMINAEKLMWEIDFSTFQGVRDGAMLGLLIGCGLRISGLINLTREQLLPITHDGRPRMSIRVVEKGDKERIVPIPAASEMMLRVYLEHPMLKEIDCELEDGRHVLFVSTKNPVCPEHEFRGARRRMNRRSVAEMIRRRGKNAGIPIDQLHPHAMRHLFGTELAEDEIDLLLRKNLMGHVDSRSTEIYEHLAVRKKIQAIDKASPMSKMRTPASDVLERLKSMGGK